MSLTPGINELANQVYASQHEVLTRQLNWLVKRDILVVVQGPGKFLRREESNQLVWEQEIELQVKDKEYIEKLEEENKKLKDQLRGVLAVLGEDLDSE